MKTSATLRVVILFGVMVVVMAAQWRTTSQLRQENRELQRVRDQTEQARIGLGQASAQHESEAQSLRTELTTLRVELQTVRQELVLATNAVKQATLAAERSRLRVGGDLPTITCTQITGSGLYPHLRLGALTNLAKSLPVGSFVHRAGGALDGVKLWNSLTGEEVLAGAPWSLSERLPLSIPGAEEIARRELRRFVRDEPLWEVDEIQWHRLSNRPKAWYYAIEFRLPLDLGWYCSFTVLVSFSGTAGTTTLREEP